MRQLPSTICHRSSVGRSSAGRHAPRNHLGCLTARQPIGHRETAARQHRRLLRRWSLATPTGRSAEQRLRIGKHCAHEGVGNANEQSSRSNRDRARPCEHWKHDGATYFRFFVLSGFLLPCAECTPFVAQAQRRASPRWHSFRVRDPRALLEVPAEVSTLAE
jgi:hypothetical protein